MGYINAQNILPKAILKLIHEYVDGEYLYIPRITGTEKSWGEKNGTRTSLTERDKDIYNKYTSGQTYPELALQYYLSEKSIQRIVYKEKRCGK